MVMLVLCAVVLLMLFSVVFRTLVLHPFKTVFYAVRDFLNYFRHKEYNFCQTGKLICYCALFGKGKTLSVVHYIVGMYRKYNDKPVWDRDRKRFVTQKVNVISNVDLSGIPYTRFVSLAQIVQCAEENRKKDEQDGTLTVTLVLGDEFSVQMNSRQFKTNIDPLFLNTLLTCRHHHITIVYDAQRFGHVDALLRQVTSYVVECNKVWRVMVSSQYDAWELENAQSPKMCKPMRRYGWFIRNRDYEAYDTLACVDNLSKSCKEGDMLTEDEIISLQCNAPAGMEAVSNPSRKYRKNMRKARK